MNDLNLSFRSVKKRVRVNQFSGPNPGPATELGSHYIRQGGVRQEVHSLSNQILSAQNTSHLNAASGKSS